MIDLDAKLHKKEIEKIYRRYAPIYDIWSSLTESRGHLRSLEKAHIQNGEAVLEVAVGTGVLFEKILQANPRGRNEGIDLTEEMLHRARKRANRSGTTNYTLRVGDAYHLSYKDNSFDVILNNYMFDLIPERDFTVILQEFKRVLKSGGRIVLVNMTRGGTGFNVIWDLLYRISPGLLGGCRGVELMPYLEEEGFYMIEREYIRQAFFPSEVIYAIKP